MTDKKDDQKPGISRRAFLGTGAAAGAASLLGGADKADAQTAARQVAPAPTAAEMAREVGAAIPPSSVGRSAIRPGSDLIVQLLRDLEIEFVASNPGSSFEGLQESIVNYGEIPNVMPEFISALHEESAVDMAHGYAKSEGKPMFALIQGTIGLQHASMAIYQAFHGRAPMVILVGRTDKHFLQQHTADDVAGLTRAFTKWDAHPKSLEECLPAIHEAYRQAITPPCGPTVVILDTEVQKEEAGDMEVPVYEPPMIPGIPDAEADRIAAGLLAASNPRIAVGRLRTPAGIDQAVELAELVGASVESRAMAGPMSFPERHPQAGPGADTDYDYQLGLERPGAQASIIGPGINTLDDRDLVGIKFGGVRPPVRPQQDTSGDNDLAADAEASLPAIIAAVNKRLTAKAKADINDRKVRHKKANKDARVAEIREVVEQKRVGWDAARSAWRAFIRSCGRTSRISTGVLHRRRSFRAGITSVCGITTGRIATSARMPPPPLATVLERQPVRDWPHVAATASSSTSRRMATSTTRRVRCGRRRITSCQC